MVVWWMFSLQFGVLLLTKWLYQFWYVLYIYNKKKSDWCLWRFYAEVGWVIKGAQRNLKPYIKMFYIHTQIALKIPNVHSRGECGSQRSKSWLIVSIMKLPQEVRQHYNAEKHTQVQAEDEPATAMQPVSQRASPPQRSIPEERSQLLPQETVITVIKWLSTHHQLTCPKRSACRYLCSFCPCLTFSLTTQLCPCVSVVSNPEDCGK